MKVCQVTSEYVREHLNDKNIYRLTTCDDGKNGKSHIALRNKPLKNLTVEELHFSLDNPDYAFVMVVEISDEII